LCQDAADYLAPDSFAGDDAFSFYRINGWASETLLEPVIVRVNVMAPSQIRGSRIITNPVFEGAER
jgi:hypothetical protein